MFEEEAEEKGIKYADNLKPSIGKFDGEEGYSWSQVEEGYENGFKDGAEFAYNKANEWHKLQKNPNDLPDNKMFVWCYYGDGCGKGYYDEDKKGWIIEGHLYCSSITAWRELPEVPKE